MLTEVMEYYGISKNLHAAGYFETDHHRQISKDIRAAIDAGRLIAVTGIVGSGKTVMRLRLQAALASENRVIVAESLAIDKERATLHSLISALFYDLSKEKGLKIPTQGERRERDLQQLFRKGRKPVVLFIDGAHDLHATTLRGLKRLRELVEADNGTLSVVLFGHPKLMNDLRRPTMEEIGNRSAKFVFDGITDSRRAYIDWLLKTCAAEGVTASDMIKDDAIDLLAKRLRTPLQIAHHLTRAFEESFKSGEKPVKAHAVEAVLSPQLDDLEPRLVRAGYNVKSLVDQFHSKPAEIKQFLTGTLDARRTHELTDQMLAAGIPL